MDVVKVIGICEDYEGCCGSIWLLFGEEVLEIFEVFFVEEGVFLIVLGSLWKVRWVDEDKVECLLWNGKE